MKRPSFHFNYNGWLIERPPKEYSGFVDLSRSVGDYDSFDGREDKFIRHIKKAYTKAIITYRNSKGTLIVQVVFKTKNTDWNDNVEEGKKVCDMMDAAIKSFE